MTNQVEYLTKKVCFTLIICLSALFIWLVPAGLCTVAPVKNEYTAMARSVIATQDTQQIQSLLNEWIEKSEPCSPETTNSQCQELFEAIELLQSALNES